MTFILAFIATMTIVAIVGVRLENAARKKREADKESARKDRISSLYHGSSR